MRALMRLRRQGAKCVGTPPGRGPGCPAAIQGRRITGRSDPGPARPWPGPVTCCRAGGARTIRDRQFAPTAQTDCAGRRQSARCDRQASPSSAVRFAARSRCSGCKSAANCRSATASAPPAARPSRTSAEARYRPAIASMFANIPGTGSAAPQPDCATRRRRFGRPCGDSNRVATARPGGSADTHLGGRPQGSCRGLPNADRGW